MTKVRREGCTAGRCLVSQAEQGDRDEFVMGGGRGAAELLYAENQARPGWGARFPSVETFRLDVFLHEAFCFQTTSTFCSAADLSGKKNCYTKGTASLTPEA